MAFQNGITETYSNWCRTNDHSVVFIGVYLRFLFEWNNPFINFLWVIIMVGVAAETAVTRTRLKRHILMIPVSVGFLVTVVLVGLYFLGFVLRLDNIFSAQYFIPIFGIIMGNMLGVNVIGLNTYYAGLKREQQLYYYLLGNGATRSEATAPFIRQALIKAFSPGIANMAVTGLVALPGTMIGQILGGSSPHVAIKYQIMIVVITVASSMLSLMITIMLASRNLLILMVACCKCIKRENVNRVFDKYHLNDRQRTNMA